MKRYLPVILVFLLLIVGTGVRLLTLHSHILSTDQSYSWRMSHYSPLEIIERTKGDANPPFYYLLLSFWRGAFGDDIKTLRVFSVLVGVLAVPVTWSLVRTAVAYSGQEVRWHTGLVAACLVAVHPYCVTQSGIVRMYSLGFFLTACATLALFKGFYARSAFSPWWPIYGFLLALTSFTHYYGLFVGLSQAFAVVVLISIRLLVKSSYQETAQIAIGYLLALAVATMTFYPWLAAFRAQVSDVQASFWIPQVSWETIAPILSSWSVFPTTWPEGIVVGLPVLLFTIVMIFGHHSQVSIFFAVTLIVAWCAAIVTSLALGQSILYDRYFYFNLLFFFCLLDVTSSTSKHVWLKCIIWLVVPLALGTTIHNLCQPISPTALEQAVLAMLEKAQDGDVVVTSPTSQVNQIHYYNATTSKKKIRVYSLEGPLSAGEGHKLHMASLGIDEILYFLNPLPDFPPGTKFWAIHESQLAVPSVRWVESWRYVGKTGLFREVSLSRGELAPDTDP